MGAHWSSSHIWSLVLLCSWRGASGVKINYGSPHTDPRTLLLSAWPLLPIWIAVSLTDNCRLMMHSCCFVFANLFCLFNFAAVSCHMATGPCCLQTVICSEGRNVMLIADPFFRKQSDKVVTFLSARLTFFVFNLQLELGTKWQSSLFFFCYWFISL